MDWLSFYFKIFQLHHITVEMKKKKASSSWRTYFKHLIPTFWHFQSFSYYQVSQPLPLNVKQSTWILLNIWHTYEGLQVENIIWVYNYLSRMRYEPIPQVTRMDDPQITSWVEETIYPMMCKLWYYSMSPASLSISFLLSSLSVRLLRCLPITSTSSVQLLSREIFIWCQLWHLLSVSFFHNL